MPPVEAKPGSPFGGDEIRDTDSVAKLKLKAEVAGYEVEAIAASSRPPTANWRWPPGHQSGATRTDSGSFSKSKKPKERSLRRRRSDWRT